MRQNRLKDHVEKLYAFHQIAQSGGISSAARHLRVSQSALSHCLKVLEGALEIRLFERDARGIRLTESGELLFSFSKKLISDLELIENQIRAPGNRGLRKLRIGTHETLAIHVWPDFLTRFSRDFPHISLSLLSGRVDGLIEGVLKKDFDLAVTVEPLAHPRLTIDRIYSDQMGLFAGHRSCQEKYAFLKRDCISPEEARRAPLLTDSFAHIEQGLPIPIFLMQQRLAHHFSFELNSFEAAIRLAAQGQGIAVLPRRNAREALKAGRLRKINVTGITPTSFGRYTICATYRKDSANSEEIRVLVKELKQALDILKGQVD